MADPLVILIPFILTTKQCYDYVGGQNVFEELLEKHSDLLKPCRTTDRGDRHFRRLDVEAAATAAHHQRTLISEAGEQKLAIKRKTSRRFS